MEGTPRAQYLPAQKQPRAMETLLTPLPSFWLIFNFFAQEAMREERQPPTLVVRVGPSVIQSPLEQRPVHWFTFHEHGTPKLSLRVALSSAFRGITAGRLVAWNLQISDADDQRK